MLKWEATRVYGFWVNIYFPPRQNPKYASAREHGKDLHIILVSKWITPRTDIIFFLFYCFNLRNTPTATSAPEWTLRYRCRLKPPRWTSPTAYSATLFAYHCIEQRSTMTPHNSRPLSLRNIRPPAKRPPSFSPNTVREYQTPINELNHSPNGQRLEYNTSTPLESGTYFIHVYIYQGRADRVVSGV